MKEFRRYNLGSILLWVTTVLILAYATWKQNEVNWQIITAALAGILYGYLIRGIKIWF